MRHERSLPKSLTRFTYWRYLLFVPTPAKDLQYNPQLLKDVVTSFRSHFLQHLSGTCGTEGCPWDAMLKGRPDSRRPFILLHRYIKTNRSWWQDKQAQQILRALPARSQAGLRRLDQQQRRQSRRTWSTILGVIERDQRVFHRLIEEQRTPGRFGYVAGERGIDISESGARRIYTAYRAHAALLLGKETPFDQLVKCPSIPRPAIKRLERERAEAARVTLPFPLSTPAPICQDMQEVFAWFALALQNLKRYRNGHLPVPWTSSPIPR